ncbi:hypothetical protein [Alcaligenes sp. SDU_A2]|uniref:hypothetical protein n=1 Tax=Alcaligenes sp. SDU_A2 TaxID=3136634 RepID=UPI003120266C
MGIIGLLGGIIVLGCFSIMSKTSRIVLGLLLAGSLYYWYSISAVFQGGNGPSMSELQIAMMLLSANIGGLILAAILGAFQRSSTSELHYAQRRKALFLVLAKWGGIYVLYNFIGSKLIDLVMGEEDVGWISMRIWGQYGFILLVALWFFHKKKKKV